MNFLADESCARPVIRALRAAGHDVLAMSEVAPGSTDERVLERAVHEQRVLITEDRDFGELVYARGGSSAGIVFLRFPSSARRLRVSTTLQAVATLGSRLRSAFVVVEPGRVRISARP